MKKIIISIGLVLSALSFSTIASNVFSPSALNEPAPKARSGGMVYSASSSGVSANEIKVIPIERTIQMKTQAQLRTGTSDWQTGKNLPENTSTSIAVRQ